jgi:hypothetical protein
VEPRAAVEAEAQPQAGRQVAAEPQAAAAVEPSVAVGDREWAGPRVVAEVEPSGVARVAAVARRA